MRKNMRKKPRLLIAALMISAISGIGLLTAGAANALDAADVIEMQRRAVAGEMIRTIILDCRLDTAPTAEELQTIVNNGATDELLDTLFSPAAYGAAPTRQAYYSVYAAGLVVPVPCSANGYCPEEDVFFHEEEAPPVVQYVEPEPTPEPTVYYYGDAPYEEYYEEYSYEEDYLLPSLFPLFLELMSPPDRDHSDRPDRPYRPERPANRPGRPDRPNLNRPDRPDRPAAARPERPASPERPARPERPASRPTVRPERPERPPANVRPPSRDDNRPAARPERPQRPERPRPPSGGGDRVRPQRPQRPDPAVPPAENPRRPGRNSGGRR